MSQRKRASSQASWSILAEGVSASRVEAHILRTHLNQMIEALKDSPYEDEIYRLCGDNFQALPKHLSKQERHLDRTNYALISMGGDFYRQRLTHEDREIVDLASKYNPTPSPSTNRSSDMRRTASEVIRNLEARVARLERQARVKKATVRVASSKLFTMENVLENIDGVEELEVDMGEGSITFIMDKFTNRKVVQEVKKAVQGLKGKFELGTLTGLGIVTASQRKRSSFN